MGRDVASEEHRLIGRVFIDRPMPVAAAKLPHALQEKQDLGKARIRELKRGTKDR